MPSVTGEYNNSKLEKHKDRRRTSPTPLHFIDRSTNYYTRARRAALSKQLVAAQAIAGEINNARVLFSSGDVRRCR